MFLSANFSQSLIPQEISPSFEEDFLVESDSSPESERCFRALALNPMSYAFRRCFIKVRLHSSASRALIFSISPSMSLRSPRRVTSDTLATVQTSDWVLGLPI